MYVCIFIYLCIIYVSMYVSMYVYTCIYIFFFVPTLSALQLLANPAVHVHFKSRAAAVSALCQDWQIAQSRHWLKAAVVQIISSISVDNHVSNRLLQSDAK